jgi:hypothetical protein
MTFETHNAYEALRPIDQELGATGEPLKLLEEAEVAVALQVSFSDARAAEVKEFVSDIVVS